MWSGSPNKPGFKPPGDLEFFSRFAATGRAKYFARPESAGNVNAAKNREQAAAVPRR